jgi:hypothetical protein
MSTSGVGPKGMVRHGSDRGQRHEWADTAVRSDPGPVTLELSVSERTAAS